MDKPPVLTDEIYWFLKPSYKKLFSPYNKHFACVVASESGGGKSLSTLSCAYAKYPDLNVNESVAFNARQALKISTKNHKTAFPLIIDDAGLTAFSGDALSREVGAISKVAQSIRYKNWQVYFNLPSLELLAKSVRITNHYYLEPVWIDYETELCYCKFQRIRSNPKGGDSLKFEAPRKIIEYINPVTNYYSRVQQVFHTVPVPRPPKHIEKEYEKLKDENMKEFREETRIELEKRHEKKMQKKPNTASIRKIVEEYPNEYMLNGEINVGVVSKKFDIPTSTAYQIVKAVKETRNL